MDANDELLQDVFGGEKQYIVPVFQRRYSWDDEHWDALWEDILSLYETESRDEDHFIGAFVCMPGTIRPGDIPKYMVIDGQQRLLTFSLLLSALRDHAGEQDTEDHQRFADEINDKYLLDEYKKGIDQYKVVSRAEDRSALFAILGQEDFDDEVRETSIYEAYRFFRKRLNQMEEGSEHRVLNRLKQIIMQQMPLAMITTSEDENPYAIFETLNERGLQLEESDLIRNWVFMQLSLEEQDNFNDDYWRPFEEKFKETDEFDAISLTSFYRDYLMRTGEYVKKNSVYHQFKERIDSNPHKLVESLNYYSKLYIWINRPSKALNKQLSEALSRIEYLDIGTAYPLLLNLLDRYETGTISLEEFTEILHALESFAIRRSICGESTRGYYLTFPKAVEAIEESRVKDSLFQYLESKGWPRDSRFIDDLVSFDIYGRETKKCRLILETLQRQFGHKEKVNLQELTIEHVLPQTIEGKEGSEEWREMLGENWERKHQQWVDTLGNLTLTGYNPELSNKPFKKKQKLFEDSKVDLNDYFLSHEQWTGVEIEERGRTLAQEVSELWPVPQLVSTEEDGIEGHQIAVFHDAEELHSFENREQNAVMRDLINYLIKDQNLLDLITLPYVPGDGERALINERPVHADGREMESYRELVGGNYLFTKLSSGEKRRYLEDVTAVTGLTVQFTGDW